MDPPAEPTPPDPRGRAEVWHCRADALAPARALALAERWCSPAELARIARLRRPADRHRRCLALLLTRRALRLRTGVGEADLRLTADHQGRPRVEGAGADVDFNLSHTGVWVAVAIVGDGARVGIDVESLDAIGDGDALLGAFAPRERAALSELSLPARRHAILRLWTLKEAWVKADGAGLRLPLDSFVVMLADAFGMEAVQPPAGERAADWTLGELRPDPTTALALAVRARGPIAWHAHPSGFPAADGPGLGASR